MMARGRYETAFLALIATDPSVEEMVTNELRDLASQADDAEQELARDYRSLGERCIRDAERVTAGLTDDGALNSSTVGDIQRNSIKLKFNAQMLVRMIVVHYGQSSLEFFRKAVNASRKS